MGLFSFEKLNVWRESQVFAREIYTMVNQFPRIEEFGLKQQMKRASASISLNLAEGTGRTKGKEQANFYKYAFSSLLEVASGLYLAKELGYIGQDDVKKLRPRIERIARQLSALRNYTLNDQTNNDYKR
jgi:four helix bundle protein